jgi:hypothetical protein
MSTTHTTSPAAYWAQLEQARNTVIGYERMLTTAEEYGMDYEVERITGQLAEYRRLVAWLIAELDERPA